MSLSSAKVVSTEPLPDQEARWIKLSKIAYLDARGTSRTWESAERRTRPSGSDIDGVGILAILNHGADAGGSNNVTGDKHILLQKQFRPPVNQVTIEIPAGLVDAGETAEQAAVRELREETGYVGEVTETSPVMFNDPGFCNTNLRMVHVNVDMDRPENKDPKPSLEDDEFIEVFSVPLSQLWEKCKELEKDGCAIDARVGTLAEGVLLAKRLQL